MSSTKVERSESARKRVPLPGVSDLKSHDSSGDDKHSRKNPSISSQKTDVQFKGTAKPEVTGAQYKAKPDVLQDILRMLQQLLKRVLCCLTCGCYKIPEDLYEDMLDEDLLDEEKTAVRNLLRYVNSPESEAAVISEEKLRALCLLTYSDNPSQQRSAALCYKELSERMENAVTLTTMEPLVALLDSRDPEVQKVAALALSNFALNGPDCNKSVIVECGAVKPLIQLLQSPNAEVQCHSSGCITTLAVDDRNKQEILASGGVMPMLTLALSEDVLIQRNAVGALLNLTILQSGRNDLVNKGSIPVLVEALYSDDPDVQYYCTAALSNLATNERHRAMMVAVGHYDVIRRLIKLLTADRDKIKFQACMALRNLASANDNQVLIVKLGALPHLHKLLKGFHGDVRHASVSCLRNLSVHKKNYSAILNQSLLGDICAVVKDTSTPDTQVHAAGTIRNLANGDCNQDLLSSRCVEAMLEVLLSSESHDSVLLEVTGALAVVADHEDTQDLILSYQNGRVFPVLISMATNSSSDNVSYNCAGVIAQLVRGDVASDVLSAHTAGLMIYLKDFLYNADPVLVHLALWTILNLLEYEPFLEEFQRSGLQVKVNQISLTSEDVIQELANKVEARLQEAKQVPNVV